MHPVIYLDLNDPTLGQGIQWYCLWVKEVYNQLTIYVSIKLAHFIECLFTEWYGWVVWLHDFLCEAVVVPFPFVVCTDVVHQHSGSNNFDCLIKNDTTTRTLKAVSHYNL